MYLASSNSTLSLYPGTANSKPSQAVCTEHLINRYRVGMQVSLAEEIWIVTALDFIFSNATQRRQLKDGTIDYASDKQEIPLSQIPAE